MDNSIIYKLRDLLIKAKGQLDDFSKPLPTIKTKKIAEPIETPNKIKGIDNKSGKDPVKSAQQIKNLDFKADAVEGAKLKRDLKDILPNEGGADNAPKGHFIDQKMKEAYDGVNPKKQGLGMMKSKDKVKYNKHGQWSLEKEEAWTPILSSEPMEKAYKGKKSGTHTISASVSSKARTGGKVVKIKTLRGRTMKRMTSQKPSLDVGMASAMRPKRPKTAKPSRPGAKSATAKASGLKGIKSGASTKPSKLGKK